MVQIVIFTSQNKNILFLFETEFVSLKKSCIFALAFEKTIQ